MLASVPRQEPMRSPVSQLASFSPSAPSSTVGCGTLSCYWAHLGHRFPGVPAFAQDKSGAWRQGQPPSNSSLEKVVVSSIRAIRHPAELLDPSAGRGQCHHRSCPPSLPVSMGLLGGQRGAGSVLLVARGSRVGDWGWRCSPPLDSDVLVSAWVGTVYCITRMCIYYQLKLE